MTIRQAAEADLPAIGALARTIWLDHYTFINPAQISHMLARIYSVDALREQLQYRSHIIYLAEDATGPSGFMAASIQTDGKATWVYVHKLYVHSHTRGTGLGKDLLEVAIRLAYNVGIPSLRLNVNRNNALAIAFYKRQGMQILLEEDIPFGPFVLEDYVMEMKVQ